MTELWHQFVATLGGSLPNLLYAVGLLAVGWIVATLIAKGVGAALKRTSLDDRLAGLATGSSGRVDVSHWVAQTVFYILMLIVVIAVLQVLKLPLATEPLNGLLRRVFEFLPLVLGAGVLALVAWVVATLLRRIVGGALSAAKIDERVSGADAKRVPLARSVAEAVYWFVILLFLPAILGALRLEGLLRPVQNMFDDVLGYLPNILAAGLIALVGWFVAGMVRRIVTNLLAAAGIDRLGEKVGLESSKQSISGLLGLAVYVLILVPVLISALNALELDAITGPATDMLYVTFDAVPLVLGAAIILLLAWMIARIVAGFVTNLLQVAGFDNMIVSMGLAKQGPAIEGSRSPSVVVGRLAVFGILLFATIEAANLLGFEMIAVFIGEFLAFASQVLMGLLVFALGFWLANVAAATLRASGTAQANTLARVAQVGIIIFAAAIGLRRTGLANDIVDLAFGLLLGAVAVSAAVAFGIGGREVAAKQLRSWFGDSRSG